MPRYIEGFENGYFGPTQQLYDVDTMDGNESNENRYQGVIHKDKLHTLGSSGSTDVTKIREPRAGNYVFNAVEYYELLLPVKKIFGDTDSVYLKFALQYYNELNNEIAAVYFDQQSIPSTAGFSLYGYYGYLYIEQPTTIGQRLWRSHRCLIRCTWHIVELYLKLSTDNLTYDGEYEVRVDGIPVLSETNTRTNGQAWSTYINGIRMECNNNGNNHYFIDDIALDTTNQMDNKSDGKVIMFRPSAEGTTNEWSTGRAGPNNTGTFYASFSSDIDADTSDGSPTGTPYGGASVLDGVLDLGHQDQRFVTFDAQDNMSADPPPNTNLQNKGCVRFKYKPVYTGYNPPTIQMMFHAYDSTSDTANRIRLHQSTNRYVYFQIYDSKGIQLVNASLGSTTMQATQWYEWEINWDLETGEHRIFFNGTLKGSVPVVTGTRHPADYFRIGEIGPNPNGNYDSYFYMKDLIIFDEPQHTSDSGYTPVDYGQIFASGTDHTPYVDSHNEFSRHIYIDYTWLETAVANKAEQFSVSTDSTSTIGHIYHVQSHTRVRRFGQTPITTLSTYLYSGSVYGQETHELPIGAYQPILTSMEQNPITSADWEPGDLHSRIRI